MKNIFYFLTASILISNNLYSQETKARNKQEKGFFNITELGYYFGVNDKKTQIDQRTIARSIKDVYTLSLRNVSGIFLTNKFSLGAGVGLDGFQVKNSDFYNTFQLFGDVRYYFKNQDNTWYVYGNLGSAVKIDPVFSKGLSGGGGIGSKFMIGWKTAMTASFGYQEQNIKGAPIIIKNRIPSVAVKAGILF
jgi:hypothetical protein